MHGGGGGGGRVDEVLLIAVAVGMTVIGCGRSALTDDAFPDDAGFLSDAGQSPLDAGGGDAGSTLDAGAFDAGRPDAGTPDAGRPDAGTPDAGRPDAGLPDAGPVVRFFGPIPYRSAVDSPFASLSFTGFRHLEDFEDHRLNTPGVTGNVLVTSLYFPPSVLDSVDGDDGLVNDACPTCDSAYVVDGAFGARFQFSPGALGAYPTHAGIVFTDGLVNGTVTFTAFDPQGRPLGNVTAPGLGDLTYNASWAEDRFFGVYASTGISEIRLQDPGANLDVDHLFYAR